VAQTKQIAEHLGIMTTLRAARREQYAALVLLAAASGLRSSQLFALRIADLDFAVGTVRVEASSDQRSAGKTGPCKNVTAYQTVLLQDPEGREATRRLKRFLRTAANSEALVFRSKRGRPLRANCVLIQGLHPVLKALRFEKTGLHAFRRGCNRRWGLTGVNPAVIRQQMGHASAAKTAHYTGEIPLDEVRTEFSTKFGFEKELLEKTEEMENEPAA
jgi:integrase